MLVGCAASGAVGVGRSDVSKGATWGGNQRHESGMRVLLTKHMRFTRVTGEPDKGFAIDSSLLLSFPPGVVAGAVGSEPPVDTDSGPRMGRADPRWCVC